MAMKGFLLLLTFFVSTFTFSQSGALGYQQLKDEQRTMQSTYYLPNQDVYRAAIQKHNWSIHTENKTWIYFTANAAEINQAYVNGEIPDYYIEYAPAQTMNDSMRTHHQVDQVHQGIGLSSAYKGKDIIIGFMDTGIEIAHPDFMDENGNTRILRIWDQSVNTGSAISAYGYGITWDSTQINAGLCTSVDYSGHGSTVAGAAAGNGRATGYNQGVAPESDIIMVLTDFNLPNWTQTVADACEYVFKVADSLGKRAVMNLSVGTYLGSHDGKDAAGIRIDNLLDAQDGRIVVAACGNSGSIGKYHCQGNITADTSFVWFQNNPSSAFGPNKIFFDLYSDMSQATYQFAFNAVNPNSNFETRATTTYRLATGSLGVPVYDTLRNASGDRIATIEIYTGPEGSNFHMQVLFSNIDSTNYHYGFTTVGSGKYDLWSGAGLGYNNMVETLPSPAVLPSIIHYNMPDAAQTIVSSWNCSPKVVSVGNTRNRMGYMAYDGSNFVGDAFPPVGHLSPGSSKGPNRMNLIKPDIAASGDLTLSSAPLWFLADPNAYSKIDSGGWHMRNGGTSMASPVVAGVAALFLERCEKGNYSGFIDALQNHSSSNAYTGTLPNNSYGYGWLNAHNIMMAQEFMATLSGDTIICEGPNSIDIVSSTTITSALWSDGSSDLPHLQNNAGDISATAYNANGCGVKTDTLTMLQSPEETILPITVSTDQLTLSTTSSNGLYQWTYNGVDISGATNDTFIITNNQAGQYDCYTSNDIGCLTYAGSVGINLSVTTLESFSLIVYPNPANNQVTIQTEDQLISVAIIDLAGKEVPSKLNGNTLNIQHLSDGYYQLVIETNKGVLQKKLVKQQQ
jgi:hypothetical protein